MALTSCKECGTEISSQATSCPKCGAQVKKRTSLFTWLVVIGIIAIGIGALSTPGRIAPSSTVTAPAPRALSTREIAKNATTLKYNARKTGFGNVLEVDFTITNTGKTTVKDIAITCLLYAKSGTQIDSARRTIYESIAPGASKRIQKFNMGFMRDQAASSSCYIADVAVN